jgi:hypothetical protein
VDKLPSGEGEDARIMQEERPLRKPYATRIRTLITCLACSNELYLIHAPYRQFKHWCLRCDKSTIHERKKNTLPKREVIPDNDPIAARERLRAYWREYSRQRRAAGAV